MINKLWKKTEISTIDSKTRIKSQKRANPLKLVSQTGLFKFNLVKLTGMYKFRSSRNDLARGDKKPIQRRRIENSY